jgi:hypothetical protein
VDWVVWWWWCERSLGGMSRWRCQSVSGLLRAPTLSVQHQHGRTFASADHTPQLFFWIPRIVIRHFLFWEFGNNIAGDAPIRYSFVFHLGIYLALI